MSRADRIKEKVPLLGVLIGYGYGVANYQREQQFRCDLHGDGSDNAPSARLYPETNSWYCFACGKSRDVISTVMEKEGLEFKDACKALELKYGLPVWKEAPKKDVFEEDVASEASFEIDKMIFKRLDEATKSRGLSLDDSLKFWEVYHLLKGLDTTKEGQWLKLKNAIQEAIDVK
jgi:hypothetical protein